MSGSALPPPAEAWQQPPAVFRPLPYPGVVAPGRTRMATWSLVLGIVAMVLNVLLVPTVLAIVFGAVSLGKDTAARGRAIAGIVLGALGFFALGIQAAIAIPVFIGVQHAAMAETLKAGIVADASRQGVVLTDVRCDIPRSTMAGSTTSCTAVEAGRGLISLHVTFTDARGGFTFRQVG